jgi:hypothetical protein
MMDTREGLVGLAHPFAMRRVPFGDIEGERAGERSELKLEPIKKRRWIGIQRRGGNEGLNSVYWGLAGAAGAGVAGAGAAGAGVAAGFGASTGLAGVAGAGAGAGVVAAAGLAGALGAGAAAAGFGAAAGLVAAGVAVAGAGAGVAVAAGAAGAGTGADFPLSLPP